MSSTLGYTCVYDRAICVAGARRGQGDHEGDPLNPCSNMYGYVLSRKLIVVALTYFLHVAGKEDNVIALWKGQTEEPQFTV